MKQQKIILIPIVKILKKEIFKIIMKIIIIKKEEKEEKVINIKDNKKEISNGVEKNNINKNEINNNLNMNNNEKTYDLKI